MKIQNTIKVFLLVTVFMSLNVIAEKKLELLEEVKPPPKNFESDIVDEPQITITKKGADMVEEYRINGELYMMKVTPPAGGPSYYLLKEDQDGGWAKYDGPTQPLTVPKWVIFRF
ncbi:Protein of unknown function DUF2782 [Methylophilaceae bacterium]